MKLKPYPEYKDSGVPWLGEIPKHWQVLRIKNIFQETDERSGDGKGTLLSLTRVRGLLPQTEATNRLASAEDLSKYKVCKPRQLVMNRMQAWSGMFAVSSQEGLVSPDYSVFCAHDTAQVFYFEHLFKTPSYVDQFAQQSKGIGSGFNRLYTPDFGAIPLVVPPKEEQEHIVGFLAHSDRLVNRLIHAKRQLIELLNEQKRAIIHRAVTRGLDPNVRMKPSGIDWLGDVPEHWEARRLKFVAEVQTGVTLGKNYGSATLEDRPYLRVANVQDGYLDLQDISIVRVPSSEAAACELQSGDVLMTEGGDIDKLGRGYIWREEIPGCIHQNHIFAVRADQRKLLPEFLVLLMTSKHGRSYFQLTAKQTTNLASTNSTTLYLLYRGNHPELSYTGGQRPIVHLEADLHTVVRWAETNNHRWAFSTSNAGAYYTGFFKRLDQLDEINWAAVAAQDFRNAIIKEGKQAEFLLFDDCPWQLIERIGVIDTRTAEQVTAILGQSGHRTSVSVQPRWYY